MKVAFKKRKLAAAVAAVALILGACGSDDEAAGADRGVASISVCARERQSACARLAQAS